MQETELKFQVPAARSAAVRRAVGTASAVTTHLQAVYVDTPELHLARAGLALRLRKEGRLWVQTLKGRGDGLMQRLEHEVQLPLHLAPSRGVPVLDLARHAGTPAAAALAAALPSGAALQPLYRTDIRRLHRRVRFQGAVIEIAHDVGALHAGGHSAQVDELEFELVSGSPAALPTLARRWVARHGLWWDCRSKSERGTRLALQQAQVPATGSVAARWPPAAQAGDVFSVALQAALAQALPNAAELASGSGTPEHLHQLRLALRRLRGLLRLLAPWGGDAEAALALEADWRPVFRLLGAARDADVWSEQWAPQLRAAGAPDWAPASDDGPALPGVTVAGSLFNDLLLRTLALSLTTSTTPTPGQPPPAVAEPQALRAAARELMRATSRTALRSAKQFASVDAAAEPDAQHRTRKRLKRLRDLVLTLQPLLRDKPARKLLRALRQALAALGALNDLHTAMALCRTHAERETQAWFAAGWFSAQTVPAQALAARALRRLGDAPGTKDLFAD